jgi:PTS system nitrogen regulatory IIA component
MEISISELSTYLGVAQNTIERWVRQGKLPISQKGTTYTFHTHDLKKWAAKHNIVLNLEKSPQPEASTEVLIPLSRAVQNGGVYFDIPAKDMKSALAGCVNAIKSIPEDFKPDLLDRLLEREAALSTGIGNGIAIPHPRVQLAYLNEPLVAMCSLEHPVDYNALDHQPVSLLFVILCPDLKMHLHLLSSLSFCLRDKAFIQFLESRPDLEQLVEKIEALQALNTP